MIFNVSIRKELARTFTATLAVLLTIVITFLLIRTLSMVSRGNVSPQDVMLVLGYATIGYMPILLALALFVTIVFVLSRMYRDSEMVIWQSAGAGLPQLLRPIFAFSWPVVAGVAVLMLVAWPWSNQQTASLILQFQQRSDISRIQPGQFQTSRDYQRVVFIEQQSKKQGSNEYPEGKNAILFTFNPEINKFSITTAQSAHVESKDADRFLVLNDGQQLEFDYNTNMRSLMTFKRYAALVIDGHAAVNPTQKVKEIYTQDLIASPTPVNQGEMSWRFGIILGCINLILIAVALGHANPRTGRNTNLLYALLTFIIYFNLINLGQNWISTGKYSLWLTMLVIHGGMFAIALLMMFKQQRGWVFFPRFSRRVSQRKRPQQAARSAEKAPPLTQRTKIKKSKPRGIGRMRTIRHMFYAEIIATISLVALGFLSLFFFFDFIDDMGDMGKKGYKLIHVIIRCVLLLPSHLYELMPIAVLIGTIFVLSRMAQNSEFTILRTSGLSPVRALKLLTGIGLIFAFVTFLLGDILSPMANRFYNQFMDRFYIEQGEATAMRTLHSIWLKDRDEQYSYAVNLTKNAQNELSNISIYAFDQQDHLNSWINAASASVNSDGLWTLKEATRSVISDSGTPLARIEDQSLAEFQWQSNLNQDVINVAVQQGSDMSIWALYTYIGHLAQNAQDTSSYAYTLWQRLLYPLSCLVMGMLALPFAYLHFRAGGISTKIFGGIMIGISFVIINSMFGHLGQLHRWPAIVSAGMPSLIYLLASLGMFTWLVRNR